eukprot:TRINITY_DN6476_c0_g1_i3.p1 TRINITY_DN6476_c0_g1~~TRINITY_DN6476_c0_g1_i3.p1  ORF type:complete len:360 (-),score=44.37 TRINITY_DN6476_c0_g1_i3:216-1295(-)
MRNSEEWAFAAETRLGFDDALVELNSRPLRFRQHPEVSTSVTDRSGMQGVGFSTPFQHAGDNSGEGHHSGTIREDVKYFGDLSQQEAFPMIQEQMFAGESSVAVTSNVLEEIKCLRLQNMHLEARCSDLESKVSTLEAIIRGMQGVQPTKIPFDAYAHLPCRDVAATNQGLTPSDRYAHTDWQSGTPSFDREDWRKTSEVSRSLPSSAAASDQPRSTIMLRNLPNNYTSKMVMNLLDSKGFAGKYDFFYLPIDFENAAAFGYCFVNLVDPADADLFWKTFENFSDWVIPSNKQAILSWSYPYQGLEANVNRYRNSPLMHHSVPAECKPQLLQNGVCVPFPPPNVKLRQPHRRAPASHAS